MVVCHDPGPWFETTLASLASQDHPGLDVVVIDTGDAPRVDAGPVAAEEPDAGRSDASDDESEAPARSDGEEEPGGALVSRVRQIIPAARVVAVPGNPGFASAANAALGLDDLGNYLLICHDDVALAPDAISVLLAEAARSNAGIVGPKLVRWAEPDRLLDVGLGVDKFAAVEHLVDDGELDQEQHDAVQDVFAVPSACFLVRTDLFQALGGFDPAMTYRVEDVDLCWRVQVAGARVVVVPDAVVRHRRDLADRRPDLDATRLAARHRVRVMLANYTWWHRMRVLPQQLLITVIEVLVGVVTLRPTRIRRAVGAWSWNLRRYGEIRRRRRALDEVRALPDSEIRPLQVRGSARVNTAVRRMLGIDDDQGLVENTRRAIAEGLQDSPIRNALAMWGLLLAVYLVGSRGLLGGPPNLGELAPFPDSTGDLLGEWWSGWRPVGLGDGGATPVGEAILGLGSVVVLGATGLARTVLIVGLVPLGLLGVWRMLVPAGSRRARIVAVLVYAAVPIWPNAFAKASLTGLVAYAAAPWILAALTRALAATPFGASGGPGGPGTGVGVVRLSLWLGLVVALAASLAPYTVVAVGLAAVGLLVGGVLVGQLGRPDRLVLVVLGAAAVAVALHLPWIVDLTRDGGQWVTVGGAGTTGAGTVSLAQLFRFDTGPHGTLVVGWAVLVPAALALVVGREWRLAWAVRGWMVAVAAWALAWAGEWGALDVALPAPEATLAIGAAGLALAAGMGMAAVEADVDLSRPGWRPVVAGVAGVGVVVALLPMIGSSLDGRWELPGTDFDNALTLLDRDPSEGSFRVAWIGDPDVMLLRGWPLVGDLELGTTDDGPPEITHRWIDEADAGIRELRELFLTAIAGDTNRLGEALAPFGVRYVILVNRLAPEPFGSIEEPVPVEVVDGLAEQLDLRRIDGVNQALTVYENGAWVPLRSAVPRATDAPADAPPDLSLAEPVLTQRAGRWRWEGVVLGEREVYVGQRGSDAWKLEVADEPAPRRGVEEWGMAFGVPVGGDAELRYDTPGRDRVALTVQAVAWLVAVIVALRLRARARRR